MIEPAQNTKKMGPKKCPSVLCLLTHTEHQIGHQSIQLWSRRGDLVLPIPRRCPIPTLERKGAWSGSASSSVPRVARLLARARSSLGLATSSNKSKPQQATWHGKPNPPVCVRCRPENWSISIPEVTAPSQTPFSTRVDPTRNGWLLLLGGRTSLNGWLWIGDAHCSSSLFGPPCGSDCDGHDSHPDPPFTLQQKQACRGPSLPDQGPLSVGSVVRWLGAALRPTASSPPPILFLPPPPPCPLPIHREAVSSS
jgi:hypothetical protein